MKQRDRDVWSAAWREALRVTSLGWDLALPIFGGVLLGHLLDRRLDTGYVFTLGLMVLGVFTGFYNVMRSIQVALLTCSRADRVDARQRLRAARDDARSEGLTRPEARGDSLGKADVASLTSSRVDVASLTPSRVDEV
jgi:hypothetical protein